MTTTPIHNLTDVWNDVATTFNAFKMNVTDTASADASKLFLLQVGGVDKVAIDKDGAFQDSLFALADNADRTKKVQFQVSGVTTGNTRTLTVPDFDGTIATLAGTETLSNKNVVLAAGSLATPSLRWDTGYGWSYDSGNSRLLLSMDSNEGFRIEDNGSGDVSWGHPENWGSTLFPSFKVNASLYSRGVGVQVRHLDVGDPGDTPEIALLIADGTATGPDGTGPGPSARGVDYPGAYLYWLPYDNAGNVRPAGLYGPSSETEVRYTGNGTTDTFDASGITAVGGDYAVYEVTASSDLEASRTLTGAALLVKDTDYSVSGTDVVRTAGNLPSGSYLRIFKREDVAMTGPFYGRPAQVSTNLDQTPTPTERGGALVLYATKLNEAAVRPYAWISNEGNLVVAPWEANMGTDGVYPDDNNVNTVKAGFSGSQWTNGVRDIDGWSALNALCMDEADGGALTLAYGADFDNEQFSIKYNVSAGEWKIFNKVGGTETQRLKLAGDGTWTFGGVADPNRYSTIDQFGRIVSVFSDSSLVFPNTIQNGTAASGTGAALRGLLSHDNSAGQPAGYVAFVAENGTYGSQADSTLQLATALGGVESVRARVTSAGVTDLAVNNSNPSLKVTPAASQVNYLEVTGAATGNDVSLAASGTDTNIDFRVTAKGSGNFSAYSNGALAFRAYNFNASCVNYLRVGGNTASNSPFIEVIGSDTNIDIALTPKGSGVLKFGTHSAIGAETVTGFITIKDAGGTSRKLAVVS